MSYCPNYTAFLKLDDGVNDVHIARARCKSWQCEHCAEINRIIWRYRITAEIESKPDAQWSFITITARGDRREESLEDLRAGWEKFIRILRKKKSGKLTYLRVYERHQDGTYHIHALLSYRFTDIKTVYDSEGKRKYSYSRWMKDTLAGLGLGFMSSAENLKRQGTWGISRYVTKYMMKESSGDFPRNLRRFVTSQGFAKLEKNANDWQLHGGFYYRDAVEVWDSGRDVIDAQTGTTLEQAHFATIDAPPDALINQADAPYRLTEDQKA